MDEEEDVTAVVVLGMIASSPTAEVPTESLQTPPASSRPDPTDLIRSATNVTGFKGVYQRSGGGFYYSKHNGAHLGSFVSAEEAAQAYAKAATSTALAPAADSYTEDQPDGKEQQLVMAAGEPQFGAHSMGLGFYAKWSGKHLGSFTTAKEAAVAYCAAAGTEMNSDNSSTGFKGVYRRSYTALGQKRPRATEHSSGEHSEEEHSSEQQEEEEAAMEQLSRTNFLAPNGEGRAMRRTRQVSHVPGMYKTMHQGQGPARGKEAVGELLPASPLSKQPAAPRAKKISHCAGSAWAAMFHGELVGYFASADKAADACVKEASRVLQWNSA